MRHDSTGAVEASSVRAALSNSLVQTSFFKKSLEDFENSELFQAHARFLRKTPDHPRETMGGHCTNPGNADFG